MRKKLLKILSLILIIPVILTAASCSAGFRKDADPLFELEYTEFPTKPYNADIVHPIRKPGDVTGEEAVAELSVIEWDYIRHSVSDDYVSASWSFRDLEAAGITVNKPSFGKVGPSDAKSECEYLTGLLTRLYKIDFESLEKEDRDFYDQIVFDIEEERYIKQYEGFAYMQPAVNFLSLSSFYVTVGFIDIRNKNEAELFIELMKDTGRYYDEVCEFEETRSAKGYASIEEFYRMSSNSYYMLTQKSQTDPFRDSFIEKINALSDITEEQKAAYIKQFDKVMEEVVIPEFDECCKRIAELAGTNVNDNGLAGFEHGKELYEHMLRKQIGRDCDIKELAKGLDIVLSMDPVKMSKPLIEGSDNQEMMDIMAKKAGEYFPELDIDYEIVKLPALFKTVGIGGTYAARYFDDPSHEIILLPDNMSSKDVVFHEGIPGHMYQYNYHKSHLKHVYMIYAASDVYAEGWATYIMNNPARMYGTADDDSFVYTGDTYREEMAQARADILINYEGKTAVEAGTYISSITEGRCSVAASALLMMPGLGISYGLGCYMTLKTLEAIRALDPNMDLKTMHTLYLDAGPGCFDRILASVKREYE